MYSAFKTTPFKEDFTGVPFNAAKSTAACSFIVPFDFFLLSKNLELIQNKPLSIGQLIFIHEYSFFISFLNLKYFLFLFIIFFNILYFEFLL